MKKFIIILLVLILVFGGGYYLYHKRVAKLNTVKATQTLPENLYTVKKGSLIKTITSNGFIEPVQKKDLCFFTSGRIKEINMIKGQRVEKGQLLAVLDNLSEKLALIRAKNKYEEAKINSTSKVVEEKLLEYKIAERNYQNTFLYAPFSGLITEVEVEIDDQVNASKPVAQIIDDSSFIVELNIDEVDLDLIELGQRVLITLDAFPEMKLTGKVTEIGLTALNQGGVVVVPIKVRISEVNKRIKPGLSVSAEIIVGQAKDQLIIPITSVIQKKDGAYVLKKVGDKFKPTRVITGISNDVMISVLDGLKEGDQIIINNYEAIQEIREKMSIRNPFNNRPPNVFRGIRGGR
ncbi:hypothetical protein BBF96_12160 [Anoxybacter fermentans]|uniref:Uncharacterized protein n=1 Tax=Anoxybacter fermentans TaxID=1323375 RepID=A0A3S9T0F5_9FIRM|nr:HlyD family efflux transporter periplasmic adaptor subunit [Anoxybacter fermentans]AZR74083.1 hypothetical protein BBF96_12160 [Anoxybacter fermentans]